jgi:predicted nucleic acid-binding protein
MNDNERIFVDTNVLVYAHDLDAEAKHATAQLVVSDLWRTGRAIISTQVLQDLYVTVTRKLTHRLNRTAAREIIDDFSKWSIHSIDLADILQASELEELHQLSFWDALIVAAALRSGATRLITEDLQDGRRIEGMLIENPFS